MDLFKNFSTISDPPLGERVHSPEVVKSNTEALTPEKLRRTPTFQWAADSRPGTETRMELVL